MALITDNDPDQVLEEAKRIQAGADPATVSVSATPEAGSGMAADSAPPAGPPQAEFVPIAEVLVCCTDMAYARMFGPAGAMHGQIREQAVKAWAACLAYYAPMVGELGPLGALAAVYGTHTTGIMVSAWMTAKSSAPLENAEAEKPQF